MQRIYNKLLKDHFFHEKNMAFVAGPRQSGKTTTARQYDTKHTSYWNWDDVDDRKEMRNSQQQFKNSLVTRFPKQGVLVLDEIHKYSKWRNWLKGFYDKFGCDYKIIVTGSAHFNIFRRGGDSLLGRYYLYRHHPLSLGEIGGAAFEHELFRKVKIDDDAYKSLWRFGGFPAPFLAQRQTSHKKWLKTRTDLLIQQDLRDMSRIEDIAGIEKLVILLRERAGGILNLQHLALDLDVSHDTVKRWVIFLQNLYYCFLVPPYSSNVARALKKMPKLFLWDWSEIENSGARFENLIASHLLKSVHYWTDTGIGNYDLFYIRDKEKREIDFLVTCERQPFMLVECKLSDNQISPALRHYQNLFKSSFAIQVVSNDFAKGQTILETKPCQTMSGQDFCACLV